MFSSLFFRISPLVRFTIKEKSMEPNFKEGDNILVTKIFFKLRRGDVIIFRHSTPPYVFCKRISKIFKNKYFVTGDNKRRSIDSRIFGSISRNDIIGKVIFKI